jgi:lysophospholipase L1-like esterase
MQTGGASNPYSYQNTWNYATDYDNAQAKLNSFVTRFWNSFNSTAGTGWAVSQASLGDGYSTWQPEFKSYHKMVRIWAFDPDTTFALVGSYLHADKPVYYTDYFMNPGVGCRWQAYNDQPVTTYWMGFQFNKFLFVNAQSITYPEDYSGSPIPSAFTPTPAKYVAMGDSFSSGEGNPEFEFGTNDGGSNENRCHRSPKAYPRLLQNDSSLNLGTMAFVACSGATTDDILYNQVGPGQWGESAQINALSADTEVVTISVGGNDIKFKEFASACVYSNCAPASSIYQEAWSIMTDSSRDDYLPVKLNAVYYAIAAKLTSANVSAKVYVVGYPLVVTHYAWESTTASDPNSCVYLAEQSATGAENIINKLNNVILQAVADFGDPRFVFVDPRENDSPFIGNELCGSGAYFNGIDSATPPNGDQNYVFHPNRDGQSAYWQYVRSKMS